MCRAQGWRFPPWSFPAVLEVDTVPTPFIEGDTEAPRGRVCLNARAWEMTRSRSEFRSVWTPSPCPGCLLHSFIQSLMSFSHKVTYSLTHRLLLSPPLAYQSPRAGFVLLRVLGKGGHEGR